MRRVRVYVAELSAGARELPREAAHYLATVHRLQAGDEFTAFDPERGVEAAARVERSERGRVNAVFSEPELAKSVRSGVTLYQALAKGDRIEQVLRAATALAVDRVVLLQSERCVEMAPPRPERVRSLVIDAARQSGRGDLPNVVGPIAFDAMLESAARDDALKLGLSPRATNSLSARLERWRSGSPAAVLVGPEGGFTERELVDAEAAGFLPSGLGPLVLRTELAAVVALGCFAARLPTSAESV